MSLATAFGIGLIFTKAVLALGVYDLDVSKTVKGNTDAVSDLTGIAPLHCCFAPPDRPLLLSCTSSPDDYITAVPFAFYGSIAFEDRTCGNEIPSSCGLRFEKLVLSQCIGRRQCALNLTSITTHKPCIDINEIALRWTCNSDDFALASSTTSGDILMPILPHVPLSVKNNIIVDTAGSRVRFKGVNWPGLHITHVPSGLDRTPLPDLAKLVKNLGFNIVRLTWDVNTVLTNPIVQTRLVAANPSLVGAKALDVMDAVVDALQSAGVMVWLDNHMLDTDWCCSHTDCNGFWFNARHPQEDWLTAWQQVASRSVKFPAIVGVGLKNEVRSVCGGKFDGIGSFCNVSFFDSTLKDKDCAEMRWSSGPAKFQWKLAAERAGSQVLAQNPNLLVSVGGLDYSTDFRGFDSNPLDLPKDRLVFEAHEYNWGKWVRLPGVSLDGSIEGESNPYSSDEDAKQRCLQLDSLCGGITCSPDISACFVRASKRMGPDLGDHANLSFVKRFEGDFRDYWEGMDTWWGYLARNNIAPVIITEFGMSQQYQQDQDEYIWWNRFSQYVQTVGPLNDQGGMDWMYWSLFGEQEGGTSRTPGATETFGILNHCGTGPASASHTAAIQSLMESNVYHV